MAGQRNLWLLSFESKFRTGAKKSDRHLVVAKGRGKSSDAQFQKRKRLVLEVDLARGLGTGGVPDCWSGTGGVPDCWSGSGSIPDSRL